MRLADYVAEVVVPFVRSTVARLSLKLNDDMPIQEARNIQNHIVQTLRKAAWKSCIVGSKDRALWSLQHRSAEKRNKIKQSYPRKNS